MSLTDHILQSYISSVLPDALFTKGTKTQNYICLADLLADLYLSECITGRGKKNNNNKNPLITRRCCVLEQLTNTPQHLTGSSPQSLQCTTDAGKQSNRSFGCCACKQPALICRIFPPGGGPPRRSVIVSAPLILLAGGWWSLTWGDGGLGQSFFIRLHRSSYPLETEKRGRGWTSCTSSSESRERDGAEGAETRFRDAAQRCRCVFVCDGETEKVCECVEQTFGLRVLRLAELAVRFWLQI